MIGYRRHPVLANGLRLLRRHSSLLTILLIAGVVLAEPAHAQTIDSWMQSWVQRALTAFRYLIAFICVVGGLGAILWGVIHFITLMRGRNSQHNLFAIGSSIAGGVILLSFAAFSGMLTRSQSSNGVEFNGSAQQIQMDQ